MGVAFIFVSLCYSPGATFKMLKAVLKKSREGGKGTKKESGMSIIAMFYTPGELGTANPGLSILWCSSAHPRGSSLSATPAAAWGAGAAGLHLPGRWLQCIYCCISSRGRAVGCACCPRDTEQAVCSVLPAPTQPGARPPNHRNAL